MNRNLKTHQNASTEKGMRKKARKAPQPTIEAIISRSWTNETQKSLGSNTLVKTESLDSMSDKGKFGWLPIGNECLPYILRQLDQYFSIRIVEMVLLKKYRSLLHPDIFTYGKIGISFITPKEARLLNEINSEHCNNMYGEEPFTPQDVVISGEDVKEYATYLQFCTDTLKNSRINATSRCGFVLIHKTIVPYATKGVDKFVPLFYFEGDMEIIKMQIVELCGWDLAYLKFCCKAQGIRNDLYSHDTCKVIDLQFIQSYLCTGIRFVEYWPPGETSSQLLLVKKINQGGTGTCTAVSSIEVHNGPATATGMDFTFSQQTNHHHQLPETVSRETYNVSNTNNSVEGQQTNNDYPSGSRTTTHNALSISTTSTQTASQVQTPPTILYDGSSGTTLHSTAEMSSYEQQRPMESQQIQFKVQKVLLWGKMVSCINAEANNFDDLVITMKELLDQFFPGACMDMFREVIENVLHVTLYSPYLPQKALLLENNLCEAVDEIPLIYVNDIKPFMPQLKYIMEHNTSKASRIHA